jgi:hypothetical protein
LLPGFSIVSFDLSRDEKSVLFAARDRDNRSRLFVAALDRRSPPVEIPFPSDLAKPVFGPAQDVFFRGVDGAQNFIYHMNLDGTGLRKVIPQAINEFEGVSPDAHWVLAWKGVSAEQTSHGIQAYPVQGGPPMTICLSWSHISWSLDRKFLYIRPVLNPDKVFAVPLQHGQIFPSLPKLGLKSDEEIMQVAGTRVINTPDTGDIAFTSSLSVYAFDRTTVRRNLYRIPLP